MGRAKVSDILWQERELLELLLFKVVEERLVLVWDAPRFGAHAVREAEQVLDRVRAVDLRRAVEVAALAAELDLNRTPTLEELASAAGSPWDEVFAAHRRALVAILDEIAAVSDRSRRLVGRDTQDGKAVEPLDLTPGWPAPATSTVPARPRLAGSLADFLG